MVEATICGFSLEEGSLVREELHRSGWQTHADPATAIPLAALGRRVAELGRPSLVVAAVRDRDDASILSRCVHVEAGHLYTAGIAATAERDVVARLGLDLGGRFFFLPPVSEELARLFHDCRGMARELEARRQVAGGTMRQELELELATSDLHVAELAWYLTARLGDAGFCGSVDERRRTALALEEALLNAVEHGNLELDSRLRGADSAARDRYESLRLERIADPRYARRTVRVGLRVSRGLATVEVTDQGRGIAPRPGDCAGNEDEGGRGLVMIRRAFDAVEYNGSTLIMKSVKEGVDETRYPEER
jgi:anti-sigma regulatory factor (Ser/Thr protein kinase)